MEFSPVLIDRLKNARIVGIMTGAGISAESGVPTFRGEDGLWNRFRPEELANFNAFINNPDLVWEWYQYRRKLINEVQPNPGHYAIVELEKYVKDLYVITQNIDDLHNRAGSKNVIELHGNINRNYCIQCGRRYDNDELEREFKYLKKVPRCWCGGLIRPDVVWFGEMLPEEAINRAFEIAAQSDVFFSIGTSGVVYPAAAVPLHAREKGAYVVEINIEYTELSDRMNETIIGKSGEILPAIVSALKESLS